MPHQCINLWTKVSPKHLKKILVQTSSVTYRTYLKMSGNVGIFEEKEPERCRLLGAQA
jgi:hypothetical protein